MGSCNTTQNERSGKDLLLKICEVDDVSVAIGTDDDAEAILAPAHGLEVGDMVRATAAELGTVDDITADQLYFVVEVPTTGSFKIATAPGGTAITFTHTITDMEVEYFKKIGGLRSSSFSFASEAIDISNHGSGQWRKIKDAAGLRTVSISGDGVYNNTTNFKAMENDVLAGNLVCLAFVDVSTGRVYHGCFKIVSLEVSGEYNGEATFTISAENSDAITIYQAS